MFDIKCNIPSSSVSCLNMWNKYIVPNVHCFPTLGEFRA